MFFEIAERFVLRAEPCIGGADHPRDGWHIRVNLEERGSWIEILRRKTDWFKVRTDSGKEGWVARDQLQRTLTPSGDRTEIRDATIKEFSFRRWEMGAMGGDFESADVMTIYGGFAFTPNLSVEASVSKVFADFSDADMADISVSIHPFPAWRVSPFFSLGTGVIRTDPKTTLVQEPDRTDQLAHVGAGVRVYLARQLWQHPGCLQWVLWFRQRTRRNLNRSSGLKWNAAKSKKQTSIRRISKSALLRA